MPTNKPAFFFGFTLAEGVILAAIICFFAFSPLQQSEVNLAATPSPSTLQNLSAIHDEIDALPIAPEVRQQMLLYVEVAESRISTGDFSSAREAMLNFCRRIEWYRYQIGHEKIDNMFNQAMSIAVDLHNASLG